MKPYGITNEIKDKIVLRKDKIVVDINIFGGTSLRPSISSSDNIQKNQDSNIRQSIVNLFFFRCESLIHIQY